MSDFRIQEQFHQCPPVCKWGVMKQGAMFWPLLDGFVTPSSGVDVTQRINLQLLLPPCVFLCLPLLAYLVHLRWEGVLVSKDTDCSSFSILYTYGFWTTETLYILLILCVCVCAGGSPLSWSSCMQSTSSSWSESHHQTLLVPLFDWLVAFR